LILLGLEPHLEDCPVADLGQVVGEEELAPTDSEQHNTMRRISR